MSLHCGRKPRVPRGNSHLWNGQFSIVRTLIRSTSSNDSFSEDMADVRSSWQDVKTHPSSPEHQTARGSAFIELLTLLDNRRISCISLVAALDCALNDCGLRYRLFHSNHSIAVGLFIYLFFISFVLFQAFILIFPLCHLFAPCCELNYADMTDNNWEGSSS